MDSIDTATEVVADTGATVTEAVTTAAEVVADAAKSGKPIVLIAALATVGVGAVGAGAYFGYRWLKNRKSGDGNVQTDGEKKNVFGFRRNKPEGGKSDAA